MLIFLIQHTNQFLCFTFYLVSYPSSLKLTQPQNLGIYATRNFYVTHNDPEENKSVKIGVWHVLPNFIAKAHGKKLNLSEVCNIKYMIKKINLVQKKN